VSDLATFCDAVLADLTTNVAALASVTEHRLAPWDPEDLAASVGEKHLAVWPDPDNTEVTEPFTTGPGSDLLTQVFWVRYWEHVGAESADSLVDETATEALLDLLNAVRARFYVTANLQLGGSVAVRYRASSLSGRSGAVRGFTVVVSRTLHPQVS